MFKPAAPIKMSHCQPWSEKIDERIEINLLLYNQIASEFKFSVNSRSNCLGLCSMFLSISGLPMRFKIFNHFIHGKNIAKLEHIKNMLTTCVEIVQLFILSVSNDQIDREDEGQYCYRNRCNVRYHKTSLQNCQWRITCAQNTMTRARIWQMLHLVLALARIITNTLI